MSLNRYAAKRDANEPALKAYAESLGAFVILQDEPVDWDLGWRGTWRKVEVKMPGAPFTKKQKDFLKKCDELGLEVLVFRTPEDVAAALGASM